jgi:hypothetical protein
MAWICLNDAFVSVVKDRTDPKGQTLLVRARRREHLRAFLGRHGKGVTILETEAADYRFRAKLPRAKLQAIMASRIDALDYDNFKNSVKDRELHDMYLTWWSDHLKMQEKAHPPQRLFPTGRSSLGGYEAWLKNAEKRVIE